MPIFTDTNNSTVNRFEQDDIAVARGEFSVHSAGL